MPCSISSKTRSLVHERVQLPIGTFAVASRNKHGRTWRFKRVITVPEYNIDFLPCAKLKIAAAAPSPPRPKRRKRKQASEKPKTLGNLFLRVYRLVRLVELTRYAKSSLARGYAHCQESLAARCLEVTLYGLAHLPSQAPQRIGSLTTNPSDMLTCGVRSGTLPKS